MLLFGGAFGLIAFALWVFCIIDVITTPDGTTRNLPKLAWIFIVILLVDVGSIAWLLAGRPWQQQRVPARTPMRATNPDDDEDFLASLSQRAEEQRRRARGADGPDSGDEPKP